MRRFHSVKYLIDIIARYILVEKVTHRVDEDESRPSPSHGLVESFRTKSQIEADFERVSKDSSEPLREALCVAVLASCTHLRASRHGIPSALSPFDRALCSHVLPTTIFDACR